MINIMLLVLCIKKNIGMVKVRNLGKLLAFAIESIRYFKIAVLVNYLI